MTSWERGESPGALSTTQPTTTSMSLFTNKLLRDDTEEEIRPPALSPYAISLLENMGDVDKVAPPPAPVRPPSPIEFTSTHRTHSRRHRVSLGAPRRISSDSQPALKRKNAVKDLREVGQQPKSSLCSSHSLLDLASSLREDSQRLKRPINTPSRRTPLVKRKDTGSTPYKREEVVVGTTATTPIKHSREPTEVITPPEQVRRALTPLSQSRINRRLDLFGGGEGVSLDFGVSDKSFNTSFNTSSFKEVLTKELQKQREQILQEVKRQRSVEKMGEQEILRKKEAETKRMLEDLTRKQEEYIEVNGRRYEVLEQIGKGGSSKVYKAKCDKTTDKNDKNVYAIKVVTLEQHDKSTSNEFKGEISILKKLRTEERVVRLVDYALSASSLLFVMECGEIDLAHVMAARAYMPFDVQFVRYHAREMLRCVEAVHRMGVVHADLKPANFLFVRGTMKLIDFGISNVISEQTVNVYKECQMGTPNYMAPETLIEGEGELWKVGKPADVWSCGCIIYQMCYGKPPYAAYTGNKKILAITNPKVDITYAKVSPNGGRVNGLAVDTIKMCLRREPDKRCTASQLLESPFLEPKVVTEKFMGDLVRSAVKYGGEHPGLNDKKLDVLVRSVWKRVREYC